MKESLVQWTLLQNFNKLSEYLDFPIARKIGQEITTNFGRIDFILEDNKQRQLIVELETLLDTPNKRQYCFEQVGRYKNISFTNNTEYCILFAEETGTRAQKTVANFGKTNAVSVKTYPLDEVKKRYTATVERLCLSFGLSLPKPTNYTICYLRWLNKILKPFNDFKRTALRDNELAKNFSSSKSTNFRCYLKLALDFEMIVFNGDMYEITNDGKEYVDNFNLEIDAPNNNLSAIDLTNEQKKILLRIITNGNWTAHKVNIYWFLRFMEVTNGEWIPNVKEFERQKLDLVNGLFNVNYKTRTMFEFLNFACNWCMELGLVDRIKTLSNYDVVFLTPLGIEINNIFSLDLQLKKNRLNLSFKYLD